MGKIYRICVTGGPGAGKTTSMDCLSERLTDKGFKVFIVPEAATMMFNAGAELKGTNYEQTMAVQTNMTRLVMALEDCFIDIAKSYQQDSVLIFDRGLLDSEAFTPPELWYEVLERSNLSREKLMERYDAVLLLMSAASGAEQAYTTVNNKARAETPEQAREADKRLQRAWLGHPHLRIIPSFSDFSDKLNRVLGAVYRVVGIPEPLEIERKFILDPSNFYDVPVNNYQDSTIEQSYLIDGSRVRTRVFGDYVQYTHTVKNSLSPGKNNEIEKVITRGQLYGLLNHQWDNTRETIKKTRRCFLYDHQYFEMDFYLEPRRLHGLVTLELELDEENQEVNLPDNFKAKEVTNIKEFANRELAKAGHANELINILV